MGRGGRSSPVQGPFHGDALTLADLSIGTTLGIWKGALEGALPGRLAAYRERLVARPAYQRALARNG